MAVVVTALSVTPVKGLRIQRVPEIELGPAGARGDRAFYIVDPDGAIVNGKRVGELQRVIADHDLDRGILTLRFPDGSRTSGRVALGEPVATTFHRRPRAARELDGPWSETLSRFVGRPLRLVAPVAALDLSSGEERAADDERARACGGAEDWLVSAADRGPAGAVSLISRGSLRRLAQADPRGRDGAAVDGRRFRMLIEVDSPPGTADGLPPHAEDDWIGRELAIGEARLQMCGHVGRCVITNRNPESGEIDLTTLKMLGTYRREQHLDSTEPLPFGIHGAVLRGGAVRVGDALSVVAMAGGAAA